MSNFKRANSVTVTELQFLSQFKRCAISLNGKAVTPRKNDRDNTMISVLSSSKQNFTDIYNVLDEIGRGGFSTVYRCQNKLNSETHAVKVINLHCHFVPIPYFFLTGC